jgi:hypothetical protein
LLVCQVAPLFLAQDVRVDQYVVFQRDSRRSQADKVAAPVIAIAEDDQHVQI